MPHSLCWDTARQTCPMSPGTPVPPPGASGRDEPIRVAQSDSVGMGLQKLGTAKGLEMGLCGCRCPFGEGFYLPRGDAGLNQALEPDWVLCSHVGNTGTQVWPGWGRTAASTLHCQVSPKVTKSQGRTPGRSLQVPPLFQLQCKELHTLLSFVVPSK